MSTTVRQAIETSIEMRQAKGGETSRIMYANITAAKQWLKSDSELARNNILGDLYYRVPLDNIELDALATKMLEIGSKELWK